MITGITVPANNRLQRTVGPMAISFGPRLLVVGAICIAISIAGLSFPRLPGELFLLMDASAKLVIGLWLFSDLFRRSTLANAAQQPVAADGVGGRRG
jgi:hypothetical protein